MKKVLSISLALLTSILILSACGKKNVDDHKTISAPKPTLSDALNTSGISLEKYDQIKYTNQQLNGGDSNKKIISILGKPTSSKQTKLTNNDPATQYTWQMGGSAQLQYIFAIIYKDKVLSKGFQQNTNSKIVSKAKIKALNNSMTFKEVKAKLGAPLSEQVSDGVAFMTYQTDKNNHACNLTFSNDKLSKTEFVTLSSN